MDRLDSLLPKVLKQKGMFEAAVASLTVSKANEWIKEHSPHLVPHIHAVKLQDGRLHLKADHPLIVSEFQQHHAMLLSYLNAEMDGKIQMISVVRS